MRRVRSSRRAVPASGELFLTMLFISLTLAGCGDGCLLIVSNPGGGGGTISGGTSSCPNNPLTGNVRLRITSSLPTSTGNNSTGIQHLFVTLRGIEASPIASDDSSLWTELAPKLATHPVQMDLLAPGGDSCESDSFGNVAVPADTYRQIRLRFSPNQPDLPSDSLLADNSCGPVGLNCIVASDGAVRPLALDNTDSELRISSQHIAGGFFRVVPDASINLTIELKLQSSLLIAGDEGVRLVPSFTVAAHTPCESAANTDR